MKCAIVCEIYHEGTSAALSGAHYSNSYRISFHIFNCDVQSMLLYTCTLKSLVCVYCAIYINIGSTEVGSGNARTQPSSHLPTPHKLLLVLWLLLCVSVCVCVEKREWCRLPILTHIVFVLSLAKMQEMDRFTQLYEMK